MCKMNLSGRSPYTASEKKLSPWLEAIGFKQNPFEGTDAKFEPYLEEYFVKPLGFDEMLDKRSSVFYASDGGGKTACRRMIENACKTGDSVEGNILCVSYDDFQKVVEQANGNLEKITARMHVKEILRKVFAYIKKEYIEIPSDQLTPSEVLEKFSVLLKDFSFDALYVLIDNVDELPETDSNPDACFTLLKPIAGTSSLMSLDGVYFKFFLPENTRLLIENLKSFRTEQVKPIEADWSSDDYKLLNILQERLKSFTHKNRTPIISLDEVSEGKIDKDLLKHSKTPRDLLRLCGTIFQKQIEHIKTNPTSSDYNITLQVLNSVLPDDEIDKIKVLPVSDEIDKIKVFISYAEEDKDSAKRISKELIKYGVNPWLAAEDILGGEKWKEKITHTIKTCSYFLVLLSLKSVSKKGFVQKEIEIALELQKELPSSDIFIIPVNLDPVENLINNPDIPEKLKIIQWVNYYDDQQNGLEKLFQILKTITHTCKDKR